MQPITVSPHATLVQPTPMPRSTRPRFLAKPPGLATFPVDHVQLLGVGVEDDGVREASDVAVIVANVEII